MPHDPTRLQRRPRCAAAIAILGAACVVAACSGGRCEIAGEPSLQAAVPAALAPTRRSVPLPSAQFDDDYADALQALQRRDIEPTAPTF